MGVLVDEEPKPGGVEVGAGADDAAGREPSKLPSEVVGEVVGGVGHHEQQSLREVLRQGRHALLYTHQ